METERGVSGNGEGRGWHACPNETAPADMAKTAPACAAAAKKPSGASDMNWAKLICGQVRPVIIGRV